MRKTDKTLKRKKVLLLRNIFLVLLIPLVVAAMIQGYREFTGQREDLGPIVTDGSEPTEEPKETEGPASTEMPGEIENPEQTDLPEETEDPEQTGLPEETENPEQIKMSEEITDPGMTLFICLIVLVVMDLAVVCGLTIYAGYLGREESMTENLGETRTERLINKPFVTVHSDVAVRTGPAWFGRAHGIGSRPEQQDSFGKTEVSGGQGVLVVVADGMGGLKGGDQISQRAVMGMLSYADRIRPGYTDGALLQMVQAVNEDVNRLLGPDGMYKSGSTLVAVLVEGNRFHWISVGDSRIYLYRAGYLLQVNQEHTQLQEWMPEILEGQRSYAEAVQNPEGRKLTSFIGMGRLKYVDYSLRSVKIAPGDRILLMSDGVFGTLSEDDMESILRQYPEVQQAASRFEQKISAAQIPAQDNYTVVILGF